MGVLAATPSFFFFLMFIMESKKQSITLIGEVQPLRNASEDFIKTVGRLGFSTEK